MTDTTAIRERILNEPDVILDDPALMQALIAANDRALGDNVVDLRAIAMARLSERLDHLEDTHRSVIAAAYDNLSGTHQIHRAVLRLLEAQDFPELVADLGGEISEILRVSALRLVVETVSATGEPGLAELGETLLVVPQGFVAAYLLRGRPSPQRTVTLRALPEGTDTVYGAAGAWTRSEACLALNLGPARLPAILALGAEDPHQFGPSQGTDLLAFLAGVTERALRRLLA